MSTPDAPPRRTPLTHLQMAFYAAGTGGGHLLNTTVVTWIAYFYLAPEGSGRTALVSLGVFTLAMTIGRIVDALADLPIAYLSDRTSGRRGRRIPYILFGGLPLIVIFILLWTPPGAPGSPLTAVWFALTINLFFIAFTTVFNPQGALLPEIAVTSRERVTLSTYNATFTMLTAAVAMIVSGILIEKTGFLGMALCLGLLGLIMTYCPVAAVRERPRGRDEVPRVTFAQTLAMVLRNRPFLHYELNMAAFYVGFNVLLAGVPFYVKVILGQPESAVGLYLGAHLAAAMLMFPFVGPLARRIGKRQLYLWGIGAIALIMPLFFFVGKVPLPLAPGTQALALLAAAGLPLGILYVLPGALISDCVDYDEGRTGTRREAIYIGVQNILQNAAVALSTIVMMTVFSRFGYSAANPVGLYLLGPLSGVMFVIAFLIFRPYPLDERKHPDWAASRWTPPGPPPPSRPSSAPLSQSRRAR